MTEKEIKRKLEDDGLKLVDVASQMAEQFPITKGSAETMLHDLLAGRRWMPKYAEWLRDTFGVTVEKPKWIKSVRERMRVAA
jgi:hypothetical protein